MSDIDGSEFENLFEHFVRSSTSTAVFRWESLQSYAVDDEDPSLVAWRTGSPPPERSVRTDPWLERIALSVIRDGKQWRRVRFVTEPLTEYTAWEMESHREAQAAGDQPFVTTVSLATPHPDFWLWDGADEADRYGVVMHYDERGAPVRFEYLDSPDRLAELHAVASESLAGATTLNVYLARHAVAGAR